MSHKLGVYWCPGHHRPSDLDYMRQLQPPVVRILDPDPEDLRQVWRVYPDAIIMPRYWLLDDGNRQQHEAMVRDPVGTAQRHAREWKAKLHTLGVFGQQNVIVTGVNEPAVNDPQTRTACIEYTRILLTELANDRIRGGALNLSVGHPAPLVDGKPDWSEYMPLEAIIRQTNSVLNLHEYWQQEGPDKPEDWGWLAGRHIKCPMQVPIVIGECGADGAIYGRYQNNIGWQGLHIPADQYADMLVWYHNHLDARVMGICVFATDYRDRFWQSFDTEPAHGAILRRKGALSAPPPSGPMPEPTPTPPQPSTLVHPLPGSKISQHWGQNESAYARFGLWGHNGTDMGGVAQGTPVLALYDGKVAYTGVDSEYGNYARAEMTGLGAYAFFAHLDSILVHQGQPIRAGQPIGKLGNSGNSTGPHLHLEIRLHNPDGSYRKGTPMAKGRVCPESWCILHGLNL